MSVTPRSQESAGGSLLILSLFPGADLLGRGFEAEGFCVVRGPDVLWGHDVRDFAPARHKFDGIIGGPPCQKISAANRTNRDPSEGVKLCLEYFRIVTQAAPPWFLLENVNGLPDLTPHAPHGYKLQRFNLNANECGSAQHRPRVFIFGYRDGPALVIHRAVTRHVRSQRCCMAGEGKRPSRSWEDFCELQGLPRGFELPGLSRALKYRLVGNGVTVEMARVVAIAIKRRPVTGIVRLCVCECGREVPAGRTLATAGCRKRMQRRRDAAAVTVPGPVTPAMSPDLFAVTLPACGDRALSLQSRSVT